MTTRVIRVEVDSTNDECSCVLTVFRADDLDNPPAVLSDLPLDVQRALRAWLSGDQP